MSVRELAVWPAPNAQVSIMITNRCGKTTIRRRPERSASAYRVYELGFRLAAKGLQMIPSLCSAGWVIYERPGP